MTDRDFELAELQRDRPLIARRLADAQAAGETAYIEKFQAMLARTDARIAKLTRSHL